MFIFDKQAPKDALQEIFPEGLPDDKEQEILDKMFDLLQKRLLLRVAGDLDAQQKEKLDSLLKQNDPKEITGFMEAHVPDIKNLLQEEIEKLKVEVKDFINKEKK